MAAQTDFLGQKNIKNKDKIIIYLLGVDNDNLFGEQILPNIVQIFHEGFLYIVK